MLQVMDGENMVDKKYKNLTMEQLCGLIDDLHERQHMTYQEIANYLETKRLTGPSASGPLSRIAVNQNHKRYLLSQPKAVDSGANKLAMVKAALKMDIPPKEKLQLIEQLLNQN